MKSSVLSRWLARSLAPLLVAACGGLSAPAAPRSSTQLVVGRGDAGAGPAVALAAASEDAAAVPIASDDAVRGSRLALVTIVVFSDFQCPFCRKIEATFDDLRAAYGEDKLRVVFKNNPLGPHEHAHLAAEIGQGVLALAGQDAFWRYHATAFEHQRQIAPEALVAWAVAAGADERALDDGLKSKRWAAKIDRDVALAERLDVDGTPSSFVNGVQVVGARSLGDFRQIVDAELAKASALLEQGVAREQLYARAASANLVPRSERERLEEEAAAEAERAAERVVHEYPVGAGPAQGPTVAPVTIVESSDFQCPFCKRANETLARVRREYGDKVRVVWRDYPLPFHPRAEPAAELARAARAQKGDAGFWQVHDLLFAAQPKLEDEDLERIAREAKLDVARAMAAVKAKKYKEAIEADVDVADDFGGGGTPLFFINGRRVVGAKPFEDFQRIIDEEIVKAGALLRAGTPSAGMYAALTKGGKPPSEPEKRAIAPARSAAPFRGPAGAKVVIEEVSDFECPFCKRAEPMLDELMKAYPGKIKIVWRDNPLPMHPHAALAAEAAREAYAQKGNAGFDKMRRLLFDNQQALERTDLERYAASIGLDPARFARALDERTHRSAVEADAQASADAGVRGTPAFFIGPYFLSGAQRVGKFRRLVDRVLAGPKNGG